MKVKSSNAIADQDVAEICTKLHRETSQAPCALHTGTLPNVIDRDHEVPHLGFQSEVGLPHRLKPSR